RRAGEGACTGDPVARRSAVRTVSEPVVRAGHVGDGDEQRASGAPLFALGFVHDQPRRMNRCAPAALGLLAALVACETTVGPQSADHPINTTYTSSFSRSASSCFPDTLPVP